MDGRLSLIWARQEINEALIFISDDPLSWSWRNRKMISKKSRDKERLSDVLQSHHTSRTERFKLEAILCQWMVQQVIGNDEFIFKCSERDFSLPGYNSVCGRPTQIQDTTRLDSGWPDALCKQCEEQKRHNSERWDGEMPKLLKARRGRGIFQIYSDDEVCCEAKTRI